jgi:hypothetical protein
MTQTLLSVSPYNPLLMPFPEFHAWVNAVIPSRPVEIIGQAAPEI